MASTFSRPTKVYLLDTAAYIAAPQSEGSRVAGLINRELLYGRKLEAEVERL